jgi:hypothetical protein
LGIDRIAMLKYGIPDLRAFFEADLRWLRHYGFSALAVPSLAEGLSLGGGRRSSRRRCCSPPARAPRRRPLARRPSSATPASR